MADGKWIMDSDGKQFLTSLGLWDICESCCGCNIPNSTVGEGRSPTMAIVSGNPAVAYHRKNGYNDLMYCRATDASGSAWGTPVIAAGVSSLEGGTSHLIVANGNPAIAYTSQSGANVSWVRATNTTGTAWGTPVVIDSTARGDVRGIAIVDGYPAVTYHRGGFTYFARATNASGTGWGTPHKFTVSTRNTYGGGLAIINGVPAVAVYASDGKVYYYHASNAQGSAWGSAVQVGVHGAISPSGLGDTSPLEVDGYPAVAYFQYDDTTTWPFVNHRTVRYCRATATDGSTWGTPVSAGPDSSLSQGTWNSMAIVDGNPAIAYNGILGTDYRPYYVRASNTTGSSWGTPVLVGCIADELNRGLTVVDGKPAVAWGADVGSTDEVYFVRASDASGTDW